MWSTAKLQLMLLVLLASSVLASKDGLPSPAFHHPLQDRPLLAATPTTLGGSAATLNREWDFPQHRRFWVGDEYLFLGAGLRIKRVAWFDVKVYAIGLYVEEAPAKDVLQQLNREGFFEDFSIDRVCKGLEVGNFSKAIQISLLRSITSTQFTSALQQSLEPRIRNTDAEQFLEPFEDFINRRSLQQGANAVMLWRDDNGSLQVDVLPPDVSDFEHVSPALTVASARFAQALFDIYLASDSPVEDGREKWTHAAEDLIHSDNSKTPAAVV